MVTASFVGLVLDVAQGLGDGHGLGEPHGLRQTRGREQDLELERHLVLSLHLDFCSLFLCFLQEQACRCVMIQHTTCLFLPPNSTFSSVWLGGAKKG